MVAISSNHAELLALYKASEECIWLRYVAQHIWWTCELFINEKPRVLYEDNLIDLAQLKKGFTKSKNKKHIYQIFLTHEQQEQLNIKFRQNPIMWQSGNFVYKVPPYFLI